jgi:hypothetical protein
MFSKTTLYRIKPGKQQHWLDWCGQLQDTRRVQGEAEISREGLIAEFFVTFMVDGVDYALGCELAHRKPTYGIGSLSELHNQHKRECLELVSKQGLDYLLLADIQ